MADDPDANSSSEEDTNDCKKLKLALT